MSLPLYRELQDCVELDQLRTGKARSSGHAGLWFERFYNRYQPDYSETKQHDNDFLDWLDEFKPLAGEQDLLDRALSRQIALTRQLNDQSDHGITVFKSPWHYASGMGYPHPLENGFNWHPTLGVPYLPGSGLKGLVRSWIEAWAFESGDKAQQQKKARLREWFGSEDKEQTSDDCRNTGKLIFFDALPVRPVQLVADVMTPHMGDWYAQGGDISQLDKAASQIPADWHSPKPIYFLTAKELSLMVCVAPRNAVVAQELDMQAVMQCVQDALEWLGAGAKTAVGYGQFVRDDAQAQEWLESWKHQQEQQQQAQQQAKDLQGLSGVALELMQHSQAMNWETDKNAFLQQGDQSLENWLEKLAHEPNRSVIQHLRGLFDTHFANPHLLSNPELTAGKKNKPVFKARAQALAKQFLSIEQHDKEG